MLTNEYGTASNIKSRVNRQSVLAAITSTQQRLKLYNRVPPNGLVLFVGTILTDEGKEKKVSFDFEPHKPINTCVFSTSRVHDILMTSHTGLSTFATTSSTPRLCPSYWNQTNDSASSSWMVTVRCLGHSLATRVKSFTNSRSNSLEAWSWWTVCSAFLASP